MPRTLTQWGDLYDDDDEDNLPFEQPDPETPTCLLCGRELTKTVLNTEGGRKETLLCLLHGTRGV